MTPNQYVEFKRRYRGIIFFKRLIDSEKDNISKMESGNLTASGKGMLSKAYINLNKFETSFQERLKGKQYDEWKDTSLEVNSYNDDFEKNILHQRLFREFDISDFIKD